MGQGRTSDRLAKLTPPFVEHRRGGTPCGGRTDPMPAARTHPRTRRGAAERPGPEHPVTPWTVASLRSALRQKEVVPVLERVLDRFANALQQDLEVLLVADGL